MYLFKSFALLIALAAGLTAETVTFLSGNGAGSSDNLINFLGGPADGGFNIAFTSTDFSNARTGSDAVIVAPHSAWGSFPSDASAKWISDNSNAACCDGSSALFALPFFLNDPIGTATLTFRYKVDNTLGDGQNQGLFINEVSLSGTAGGGFDSGDLLITKDITGSAVAGQNWLYVYMRDEGGPSGMIFSGSVETTLPPSAVPEPGTALLFASAVPAALIFRRFRRR